jgi:hydroxymethylpyrimidine pyrophosphatase-like HAD family hydrolase
MRNTIYFTDLDDTLFTSRRKVTGPVGDPVTTAKNGHHSYMNAAQEALLDMMRGSGEVIPVTARSSDAFGRVHIDFGTRRAILANGAVILDENGLPDPEWLAHTAGLGRSAETQMTEMMGTITEEYGDSVRSWIVSEFGAPVYLCAKMNVEDPDRVSEALSEMFALINERFDINGFQHHVNGNNLSLTPLGVSKRAACERLIEQLGDREGTLLVGAGDSLTDLPFMGLCDVMMVPSRSQISERIMPRSVRESEDV